MAIETPVTRCAEPYLVSVLTGTRIGARCRSRVAGGNRRSFHFFGAASVTQSTICIEDTFISLYKFISYSYVHSVAQPLSRP